MVTAGLLWFSILDIVSIGTPRSHNARPRHLRALCVPMFLSVTISPASLNALLADSLVTGLAARFFTLLERD